MEWTEIRKGFREKSIYFIVLSGYEELELVLELGAGGECRMGS